VQRHESFGTLVLLLRVELLIELKLLWPGICVLYVGLRGLVALLVPREVAVVMVVMIDFD
jgi:hypothetical protein